MHTHQTHVLRSTMETDRESKGGGVFFFAHRKLLIYLPLCIQTNIMALDILEIMKFQFRLCCARRSCCNIKYRMARGTVEMFNLLWQAVFCNTVCLLCSTGQHRGVESSPTAGW